MSAEARLERLRRLARGWNWGVVPIARKTWTVATDGGAIVALSEALTERKVSAAVEAAIRRWGKAPGTRAGVTQMDALRAWLRDIRWGPRCRDCLGHGWVRCPQCGGAGASWQHECPVCDVSHTGTCNACDGEGELPCVSCFGTGRRSVEREPGWLAGVLLDRKLLWRALEALGGRELEVETIRFGVLDAVRIRRTDGGGWAAVAPLRLPGDWESAPRFALPAAAEAGPQAGGR